MRPDKKCVNFVLNGSAEFSSPLVVVTFLRESPCLLLLIISYLFSPVLPLMGARSDFTPRTYQAALILKLINNTKRLWVPAGKTASKARRNEKKSIVRSSSNILMPHSRAPSLPHITLHCQLLAIRRVFNWGPGGDGKNTEWAMRRGS